MPKRDFLQAAFSGGEQSPLLAARGDIKGYYQAGAQMKNLVPLPYGGFESRPGMPYVGRVRRILEEITVTEPMLTAPLAQAGTLDELVDGDDATLAVFNVPAAPWPKPFFTIDLGAATVIAAVDIVAYKTTALASGPNLVAVETSPDAVTWTALDGPRDIDVLTRTRRFALAPQVSRTCRYIRFVVVGAGIVGQTTIGRVRVWREGATASAVKLFAHKVTDDTGYIVALTDRNAEIYKNGNRVASVPTNVAHAQVPDVNTASSLDTFLTFHPDCQPWRLFRQGSDDEWDGVAVTFQNIPTEKFDGVTPEAIMSAARGWPACACFYQQRLVLGGFKALPQTVVLSLLGDVYNLNTGGTLATDAIRADIEADENETPRIVRLRAGRRLEIYASNAFFYVPDQVIAKGAAFGLARSQGSVGASARPRVTDGDGAAFFVQTGGTVLRELLYVDADSDYKATPISTLSPHLIRDPVESAKRAATNTTHADHVYIINADGKGTMVVTLRSQDITGLVPWETDGLLKSTAVDRTVGVYFAVERNGNVGIERMEADAVLDASVRVGAGVTVVTGLDHLEGKAVWAWQDGSPAGPWTVTGGQITLDTPTVASAEVGLFVRWTFEMLRIVGDATVQIPDDAPRRCHGVTIWGDARSLPPMTLTANGDDVMIVEPEEDALGFDTSLAERLGSARVRVDGLMGFDQGQIKLEALVPAPVRILAIARAVHWRQ